MTPSSFRFPLRAVLATGLLLAGAATTLAAAAPITSDSFAPDWQSHTQALINKGPARNLTSNAWFVPDMLPPGQYVLVNRSGDKAELIDGYTFKVRRGDVTRDVHMVVPPGYDSVEALPASFVPELAGKLQPTEGR